MNHFHKPTGDKDSKRRGRYLKQLFDANVLGTKKSLLNRSAYNEGFNSPSVDGILLKHMPSSHAKRLME
jgi:hypothetical protein